MMNTRKIAADYRLAHWARVIHERAESGLSVKAFCESAGFRPNSYFYWQRKLREAACGGQPALPAPCGWTSVAVATSAAPDTHALTVEIGKCRVLVGMDTDERLLAKVCGALASIC
jgi:putative transposase